MSARDRAPGCARAPWVRSRRRLQAPDGQSISCGLLRSAAGCFATAPDSHGIHVSGRVLSHENPGEQQMSILKWALIFLVVSIVAGLLGFTGVSAASADIARVLFYIFVVIFLVLLILGLTIFRA